MATRKSPLVAPPLRHPLDFQRVLSEQMEDDPRTHTLRVPALRAGHVTMPRVASGAGARPQYDWRACAIALVVGFAVAVPAALAVTHLIGSTMFLVVIVTLVGTGVTRWTYARIAKPGSRPIED